MLFFRWGGGGGMYHNLDEKKKEEEICSLLHCYINSGIFFTGIFTSGILVAFQSTRPDAKLPTHPFRKNWEGGGGRFGRMVVFKSTRSYPPFWYKPSKLPIENRIDKGISYSNHSYFLIWSDSYTTFFLYSRFAVFFLSFCQ